MKRKNLFITLFLCASLLNYAQLGKLKKIVKDTQKETKKEENTPVNETKKEENTTANTPAKEEKKEPTIAADFPTDGITSPMHQKHLGKIVFSLKKENLDYKEEKEETFITKATVYKEERNGQLNTDIYFGDDVRYRVYMGNSLANYLKSQPSASLKECFKIKFYIDGVVADSGIINQNKCFDNADRTFMTTFRGSLKPGAGKTGIGGDEFVNCLKKNEDKLTLGDHKLKIEYIAHQNNSDAFNGPVVASGEITLTFKKKIIDPNDEKVCMPKAKMVDKVLSASMVKAYKAKGYKDEVKEVRITSEKWWIVRNKLTGIITSRGIEAVIATTNGNKCTYQSFNFYQNHDGSAYEKDVYVEGSGWPVDANCGCFK